MKAFRFTSYFFILSILTIFNFACSKGSEAKPNTLKESLVGTWNITSLTLDGFEYIGGFYNSATSKFEAYSGKQGYMTNTVIFYDLTKEIDIFNYEVPTSGNDVTLINLMGNPVVAHITITGDQMLWEMTQTTGELFVCKATRL